MASKLYNFPWGPYPRRLTLYLAEKDIADIELVEIEFPHRPELWPRDFLRSLNPAASLPVLDVGNGVVIRQSLAILEYLEERYPQPTLLGATAEARAATRELVALFDEATTFFGIWARQGSRLNAAEDTAETLRTERHAASPAAAAVGAERFGSKLRTAEAFIAGSSFLTGDAVTIADVVAMALLEFVQEFYGVELPASCPKLLRWYATFSQRPAVSPCRYPSELKALAYGLPRQTGYALT
jgi:glutathione S-transferase